jgi:hypothetical protein
MTFLGPATILIPLVISPPRSVLASQDFRTTIALNTFLLLALCAPFGIYFGIRCLGEVVGGQRKWVRRGCTALGLITAACWVIAVIIVPKGAEAARHKTATDRLRQIGRALLAYYDEHRRLPPAVVYAEDGRPLYSWRVVLLPYLEEPQLYQEFHLDEPWDSPHNAALLPRMPTVYASPGVTAEDPSTTYCQLFVGEATVFKGRKGPRLPDDFQNGTSRTILLAEASDPVPWTKPTDLTFDPNSSLPGLGGVFRSGPFVSGYTRAAGFHVLMADGSVRFLRNSEMREEVPTIRNAIDQTPRIWVRD